MGANMPAVLLELGFLSNEGDALRLSQRDHRRRLARAIADAVTGFIDAQPAEPVAEGAR
jgi:N-acetylmuramoyl-L-alanine amidase